MPEIGEVARVVHYLNKHLVRRTISTVVANEDDIVYGKVGCSASQFQKAVQGRTVTGAGQQGKYFYITLDQPPHPVLHLGMTGWVKFNCEETAYYRQAKVKPEDLEWPPKYAKFILKCDAEQVDGVQRDAVEIAFVDARRLARIRLVDCDAQEVRKVEPLSKNGPDPVVDKQLFTVEFLTTLLRRKKVPVKALLLDQANISGIGNWVADEVMYQARLHPEQYSNTFDDDQVQRLYNAITTVCGLACSTLADSTQFPETWLMKYRWDKGKKDANVLPDGNKIVHLKVGGRTSAIVPAVQKKTAAVAGDVEDTVDTTTKRKPSQDEDDETQEAVPKARPQKLSRAKKEPESDANGGAVAEQESVKSRSTKGAGKIAAQGSRRSSRVKTK
ncbi:hypothetical protein AMS68_007444 [Peltaster fructicola]|uniref:Formamidopyrimidine-DNA glycosylase catalytic domain-containing protein n=1 Tax=Peltaster fructicola TaxID=286661 RepID=A0A6H0Y4G8_9PEZI|nr:hypothetical protein AMS68_007444 [Peltaster fructicola]